MNSATGIVGSTEPTEERSVIFAGDYLNKLSGEQLEYECRRRIDAGATQLVVNFSKTEIVNSIGISILLGVIDIASNNGAAVVFSDVKEETVELFDMLGLTKHVTIA
ncbi:MAG: STAS domain-containing protein [Chloracidobacterium sp.]|nr:STAS domain-containing protein [Chloracidobacterium sp.]